MTPRTCSPPGSSVHEILQARIVEWVAIPSPWDLPDPGSKPGFLALQADSLCLSHQGNPHHSLELKIPERLYYLSHASGRHSRKDSACLGTHLWINNHGEEDGLANWCGLGSMPTLWVGSALPITWSSQVALVVKNPPANAGDTSDMGSITESETFPWRKTWQPTPVFLSGGSHGQRSLEGYSPWSCKESDMTEAVSMHIRSSTQTWLRSIHMRGCVLWWGDVSLTPEDWLWITRMLGEAKMTPASSGASRTTSLFLTYPWPCESGPCSELCCSSLSPWQSWCVNMGNILDDLTDSAVSRAMDFQFILSYNGALMQLSSLASSRESKWVK